MTRRPTLITLALAVVLVAPLLSTLSRPPDFDETNFLVLAKGALADPWRPHAIAINWQGTSERAFDVLSNPPGIAWWLAPVLDAGVLAQRLWMLPWTLLAALGAARLGEHFLRSPSLGVLLLLGSPIAMLSSSALLPDAPLYACVLAGVGGFVLADDEPSAMGWAFVAGTASLFRYSGLAVLPLLPLFAWLHRRPVWSALPALLPIAALMAHDLHAYGATHLFAMGSFQATANTPVDWGHKAVASLCMLGGAAALPVYRWDRPAFVAAFLGALVASPWGWTGALFGALGGAALRPVLGLRWPLEERPQADQLFLATWAVLAPAFLLTLRFAATRYWLPFLPAVLLAFPAHWPRWMVAVPFGLGSMLAIEDNLHARADAELAERAASVGTGGFVGHWGWQHVMESHGWTAIDEGSAVAPGTLVAVPTQAWPQAVELRCDHVRWEGAAWSPFPWLPRGYSAEARANLHASFIAGRPAVRTVAPWWFARDAYESARVCAE
jgi:hypothetical protein